MIRDSNRIILYALMLICVLHTTQLRSQIASNSCKQKIYEYAQEIPGLEQEVSLSVAQLPLKAFLRTLANAVNLNMSIDPDLKYPITNNFVEVKAKDIVTFLCQEYDLDVELTGTIISISKYEPSIENNYGITIRERIHFDTISQLLSLDLHSDTLEYITREITYQTGVNIILTPGIRSKTVSMFINDLYLEDCLQKLAQTNNLQVKKDNNVFIIDDEYFTSSQSSLNKHSLNKASSSGILDFNAYSIDNLNVYAYNAPIQEVLTTISKSLDINFFIYSEITGQISINLKNCSYEEFLEKILKGTQYTYKAENDIYLIGDRQLENLRCTKTIQLIYRSVEDILEVLPENLKQGVEIYEFRDLNSLIVSGSEPAINDLESVIKELDKTVPVILIEVMILDSRSNYAISTGIHAGIGDAPVESGGELFPAIDYTFSSESINKLLGSFEGFGWFNIGKVVPNFYMTVKAMEENGLIKIRSTPKLSTLNGHEATLTIGNTEYYLEETNSVVGTQNPQNITTQLYKPVEVNFVLRIKPILSGNDQITLDITVEQSDFTSRISKEAPPGNVSRSFNSLIRMGNGEMVLLGGLEEKKSSETSRGIPVLSRIPILKWIFSSRTKENSFDKLNIFIKPTIIL